MTSPLTRTAPEAGATAAAQPAEERERIFGPGEMAERTRRHDWSGTRLGLPAQWPDTLVISLNLLLASQHPMLLFWGEDLTQFYNDAAISFLGQQKHPEALGQRADVCWAEVWHIVGQQILQALSGEPVWAEDQLVPISRQGVVKDAWFTYSYSPIRDADGAVGGVLVTAQETTKRVLAERAGWGERERLTTMFQQAPAFFALLRGPDHVFERMNPQYERVIGGRDVLGKPVAVALPEVVEQGYLSVLDRVYQTGEPFTGRDLPLRLAATESQPEEYRNVDFVYQPLREADGTISGIFVLGVDATDRKLASEALKESERSAAMILESVTDGFQLLDADGRFTQFNATARAIYRAQGIDPDSLLGQRLVERFPDVQETEIGTALFRAMSQRRPSTVESYYPGFRRWFSVRHYPMLDGGVAIFFQDVTNRKTAEGLLQEQRERFAFATDAAQLGYWFCDLPFDKLIWDTRVKEHFGLPPDADVDIGLFYDLLHPDDRETTRKAIAESIANHTRYDVEYRTVAPNGRIRWIHALGRTAYGRNGEPKRFDGVTQDVTALKNAQEALDSERRRLAAVFANVPIGLMFMDSDGKVLATNRQAEIILGHEEGRLTTGSHYLDWPVYNSEGRKLDASERPITLALTTGGIHRLEYLYRRGDGAYVWLETTGAAIHDADGRIVGAIAAIVDIDSRKKTQEALVRSEKLAVVGRLATTISHEINNPLESVTNLLYLINENAKDGDTRTFSRMAQDELARVSHIVTHTLRFNRQTNEATRERIADLLDSSVAIYDVRLRYSNIELVRDYEDTQHVLCFGSELRQVFANFIGNSFDATKTGGRLLLRTRDQANWRTGEPGVRVTIADTGHGIDETTRKRLFEAFYTTKGANGTGLGLWVSREILNKHRAELHVKSRTKSGESGTAFSIWLPLTAASNNV